MKDEFTFRGRALVIVDDAGKLIDDIDTDMIFHNAHLHITDLSEMGRYAFGNLAGWRDFPANARAGDIIIAGANFGCGSSRQQAVDCFRSLGISAIIAQSFGAIYLRNAINSAFPVGICDELKNWDETAPLVESGDEIEVDFESGRFVNITGGVAIPDMKPWSKVQKDVFKADGLLKIR